MFLAAVEGCGENFSVLLSVLRLYVCALDRCASHVCQEGIATLACKHSPRLASIFHSILVTTLKNIITIFKSLQQQVKEKMLAHRQVAAQRLSSSASSAAAVSRPATLSRRQLSVCNSAAASAQVPMKAADGAEKGEQQLALKVAEETAKGLVHRYMVMVQQNKRRVGVSPSLSHRGWWFLGRLAYCCQHLHSTHLPTACTHMGK